MKRIRSVGLLLVLVFTVARSVTAVDLKEVFERMAKDFEADHAGVHVALQLAGSQELRAQIENGGKADVFASRGLRGGDTW